MFRLLQAFVGMQEKHSFCCLLNGRDCFGTQPMEWRETVNAKTVCKNVFNTSTPAPFPTKNILRSSVLGLIQVNTLHIFVLNRRTHSMAWNWMKVENPHHVSPLRISVNINEPSHISVENTCWLATHLTLNLSPPPRHTLSALGRLHSTDTNTDGCSDPGYGGVFVYILS